MPGGMREGRQTSTVAMGSGPDVARESADNVMFLGNNLVLLVGHLPSPVGAAGSLLLL